MFAQRIDPAARRVRLDALLWFLVPALTLFVIPVGFVSNDGLGHSVQFAAGAWRLNPNHLLFEPLGAWWLDLCARWGCGRAPVDQLKLLSALAGALAAAVFRASVAPRLTANRSAANWATAWFALSSAFLRLWVSDEHHMIQMPLVVAAWWAALRVVERPSWGRAVISGAAVGAAALAFISNLVLGVAVALAVAVRCGKRRQWRLAVVSATGLALGALLVAGPFLIAAWLGSRGAGGALAWILSYGGHGSGRGAEAYGLVLSGSGLAEAALRASYGGSSALVDLTPLGAAVRDREAPGLLAIAGAIAFLAAATALLYGALALLRNARRADDDGAWVLIAAWVGGILAFGFRWNNSDDQFYFQLAPVFGALAAAAVGTASRRPRTLAAVVALGALGLAWNLVDVTARRILYPRAQRQALLTGSVAAACLVIVPGFDEPELLLRLAPGGSPPVLALTQLASAYRAAEGLRLLEAEVGRCLAADRPVALVDVFDFPPNRAPWKFLHRLGYDHPQVELALARFPVDPISRSVGPFRLRWAAASRDAVR